ncbi:WD repeat-containing protein 44-like [Zingiber officinale]|uniref:WD repeat-containing protein 44 n=1 Tax=Zingiber officinale TaxID=94328 RepID=A0A8J5KP22_ZINOF|nr:WD repeat-containing protein 44-like [Zingiber officinale]KAG6485449.1 hypothetical protein ZIOFF_053987 [Zingiber officinale]
MTTATESTRKQPPRTATNGSPAPAAPQRHHQHEEADQEEEEEGVDGDEVGEEDDDSFFESFDRVPSNVSFHYDLPTDSDDDEDEDDARTSFASAIAPPCHLRGVTFSREEFLQECQKEECGSSGYDYGIWMDEPTSIEERRRRLLQGMGFASGKDLHSSLRIRCRKVPEANGACDSGPMVVSSASPPHRQAVISRCRSDAELTAPRRPSKPSTMQRSASSPPTLCDRRVRNGSGAADGAGIGGGEQEESGVFRIKNLDTGKELLVSESKKDGDWGFNDLQTGMQLSMEEFEQFLGTSPIVKELMRRVSLDGGAQPLSKEKAIDSPVSAKRSKLGYRKKGSWLKNIKYVANSVAGRSTEKEEKGDIGYKMTRKSTGDGSSELMKVHQHGKSYKELTGLYMSQEIRAHEGSIWSIKFSCDGKYLASAGEDRVVRVWQVRESDILSTPLRRQEARSLRKSTLHESPDRSPLLGSHRTRRNKMFKCKKSLPDYIVLPEVIFSLSEEPICSLEGHLDDVLDLSWSKSQHLLSSSMDKTVRLWNMESKVCLKLFAHNDYVTCIQFNPIDDRYFISGSLDSKVRIWSIPEHHVVDWSDLHEMVTAACYTPDGQAALVGSHKGSCRRYKTFDCKLSQESQIGIRKKKATHAKKITGFQFAPGDPSEVLITSADSRVRVFNGLKMIHKFRGFRNTSSQISASYTSDGKYVICASEDSHVYLWKRETGQVVSSGVRKKAWTTTRSHEYFYCKDVSVAIPWPNAGSNCFPRSFPPFSQRFNQQEFLRYTDSQRSTTSLDDIFHNDRSHYPPLPPLPKKSLIEQAQSEEFRKLSYSGGDIGSDSFASGSASMRRCGPVPSSMSEPRNLSSFSSWGWYNGGGGTRTSSSDPSNAWGLIVVTAGLSGNIRIYQNFGMPVRLSRQTNLF